MLDKKKKNLEVCFLTDLEGGREGVGNPEKIHTHLSHIQEIEVQYPPTYFFS